MSILDLDPARSDLRRPPARIERAPTGPDELVGLELEPGTRDVARRLLDHGVSAELARVLTREILRRGAQGTHAIDAAAELLARSVEVMASPRRPRRGERTPLFAFVGPTGVGKTTALVKLGRKLIEAGRRVVFASLDPLSLAALERVGTLEGDVDRGEIPLLRVREPADLRAALARTSGADAVLLDTPGLSPRDETELDELAREVARLAAPCELQTLLVLSAATGRGALQLSTRAFARFRPDGAVLTKLDETDEPGAAWEALVRGRIPCAFLCDGQDARAHLVRPTPEALADLVLRGRLASQTVGAR